MYSIYVRCSDHDISDETRTLHAGERLESWGPRIDKLSQEARTLSFALNTYCTVNTVRIDKKLRIRLCTGPYLGTRERVCVFVCFEEGRRGEEGGGGGVIEVQAMADGVVGITG